MVYLNCQNMFDIRGKNIIITGSGKGIGLQLANGISEQENVIRIDKNFKKNKNFVISNLI